MTVNSNFIRFILHNIYCYLCTCNNITAVTVVVHENYIIGVILRSTIPINHDNQLIVLDTSIFEQRPIQHNRSSNLITDSRIITKCSERVNHVLLPQSRRDDRDVPWDCHW